MNEDYAQIKPSQEFVMACRNEAKRIADHVVNQIPENASDKDIYYFVMQSFKQYGHELRKMGFTHDFSDGIEEMGHDLFYFLVIYPQFHDMPLEFQSLTSRSALFHF